jgi:hypothetical protein
VPSPAVSRARARVAGLTRHRTADDPAVAGAARDLAAEKLAEHIRAVVDAAPSLTAEQIERLRGLLPAPAASPGDAAEPDSAGSGGAA